MTQPTIFISYCRKDTRQKDKLVDHLGVLQHQGRIVLWSDDRIRAGSDWKQEISEAMAQARVAILLISANFLTSDFILDQEVPSLLERRQSEGLTVFPVIAKACAWQTVDWLLTMSVRPQGGRPIWGAKGRQIDEDLTTLAMEVAAIVETNAQIIPTTRDVYMEAKGDKNIIPKQRIQVYVQGDFFSLSVGGKDEVIKALAEIMRISPQAIEVYHIYEGSIVFEIGVPSEAVQYLRSRLESNDTQLHQLKVERVLLGIESGNIEEWIIKEEKFDLKRVPFQSGGPLRPNSPVYIWRKADNELLQYVRQMQYVQLTEPRQQGKTSLIYQLHNTLANTEYKLAYVDAESLASENVTAWYQDLAARLRHQLGSEIQCNDLSLPSDSSSWRSFLRGLVTAKPIVADVRPRLIIVLDEVGSIPPSLAEGFFRVLREVFSVREFEAEFHRLSFILAGAFDPRDLIQDQRISPFNIAHRVNIEDMDLVQVESLVRHLGVPDNRVKTLAERLYYWTDGQPYLTQRLCLYLAESDSHKIKPRMVDIAVNRFLQNDINHLPRIFEDLKAEPNLLEYTYEMMMRPMKFIPAIIPQHFRLAHVIGVIKSDGKGYCRIRNRIYERVLQSKTVIKTPPTIFISYSRQDEVIKDELITQLGTLQRQGLIETWVDDQIKPGVDWAGEIEQAIRRARVAILLITKNFLNSEFILQNQVKQLLERQEREGLIILPVIAQPCAWRTVRWLDRMEVRPRHKEAVWRDEGRYVSEDLTTIVEEIARIMG